MNNNLLKAIIETFEDFLEEKGIDIPNPDKEDDSGASIIYGMDFGCLLGELRDTLSYFGIDCEDSWE